MGKRPLIGITGPDRHGAGAWWFTRLGVWLAGGRTRRITPSRPAEVDDLAGLIFGGGADVDPELYGESRISMADLRAQMESPTRPLAERLLGVLLFPLIFLLRRLLSRKGTKGRADAGRDELEYRLLADAHGAGLPLLGICRGAQLLNVYRRGSLHQSLSDFYEESPQVRSVLPGKPIELVPDAKLTRILGPGTCWVNALHDQAIDDPGEGLRIVARERSGVVQAIEADGEVLILGVQWHPEYLPWVQRQRRLFQALVRAARGDPLS